MKRSHLILSFSALALIAVSLAFTGPKPKKKKKAEAEAASTTTAAATDNHITWYNFNEGLAKAKKEKKILVVDTYTDWCGWCKKMDHDTYENADIVSKMNQYCVAVKFNPEVNATYDVNGKVMNSQQLLTWLSKGPNYGYPTTFFWVKPNADEKVYLQVGYQGPTDFNSTLNTYIQMK